ncbi:putative transposase [Oscillibacter valericigenes Sjm18-20]|nr:putative transposase [Oscillibacter valericigenes Sjm18-20]
MESGNQVPDGDTLGRFRNILAGNRLPGKLLTQVAEQLQARDLLLKKETIVDSAIISAPSSTENREH